MCFPGQKNPKKGMAGSGDRPLGARGGTAGSKVHKAPGSCGTLNGLPGRMKAPAKPGTCMAKSAKASNAIAASASRNGTPLVGKA